MFDKTPTNCINKNKTNLVFDDKIPALDLHGMYRQTSQLHLRGHPKSRYTKNFTFK